MGAPLTRTFVHLNIKEINKARVEAGLTPIKFTMKNCMSCENIFQSEGAHHRMCGNCRKKTTLEII